MANADIVIERLEDEGKMGPARGILLKKGMALAAVGSLACLRSIYLTACQLGRTDYLFLEPLTAKDYALGRNTAAIRRCVQRALDRQYVRGVVIYASCMDILAYWNPDEIVVGLENPRGVPVELFYRGPMAKRRVSPMEALKRIWEKWGVVNEPELEPVKAEPAFDFDDRPDFEGVIETLKDEDCDILLLTPGGCKSCISCQIPQVSIENFRNTRFSDVFVWNCSVDKLCDAIARYYDGSRPLYLLNTAVTQTIGVDLNMLCGMLVARGIPAIAVETNGFDNAEREREHFQHQIENESLDIYPIGVYNEFMELYL